VGRREPLYTVDEIVSSLRHSSVPTILVEGPDDMMVYRWLNQYIKPLKASPINCGGRKNLLSVYERRDEFSSLKTVFLADQDLYVFLGIPNEYSGVIWTTGYSIENDIYAGSTKLEDLFDEIELDEYKRLIEEIIEWFTSEVEKYKQGNATDSKIDIKVLYDKKQCINENETYIDNTGDQICLVVGNNYNLANQNLITELKKDFRLKLRGKIIFKVLSAYLNVSKRDPKYKTKQLYEIGAKPVNKNFYIKQIIEKINLKLGNVVLEN